MQFLFPSLTWGFLLILVPLLIHLINMMRQKRVSWAAMEFLLRAHKKQRKWIWLMQFLLLASRIALMAIAVAMLAHLVTREQWSGFFGGKTVHHIVLLDDSYSMSDIMGSQSAFDHANSVLTRLADRAMSQDSLQKFTVLRFSRAAQANADFPANQLGEPSADDSTDGVDARLIPEDQVAGIVGAVADLNAVSVDADFDSLLETRRRLIDVSQTAATPDAALQMTAQLLQQDNNERQYVYVVSDFRESNWQQPKQILESIQQLESAGAEVQLVRCVENSHPNLAVVDIQPTAGTRAAGVPLFIDVSIANFGSQDAFQVAVDVQSTYFSRDHDVDDPVRAASITSDLPKLYIERISPGETVTRSVQVYFPTSGQHVVSARLPADPVATDNSRWCVVDFPDGVPVLVIDGDPHQVNAAYLRSVFQPGERVQTGIRPVVQPLAFLRDTQPDALAEFHTIYLLDVPRLDLLERQNLAQYVDNGGGLAVFMGPHAELDFYQKWHQDGSRLFPAPLERIDLVPTGRQDAPDVIVRDHPIFSVLQGEGKVFAAAIRVEEFAAVPVGWVPPDDSTINVLAELRHGPPLAVEHTYGAGRVVAMLTTLAPTWNSWATQPTFPVMLLQLQSYLDAGRQPMPTRMVGAALNVQLTATKYHPQVTFMVPGGSASQRLPVIVNAIRSDDSQSPVMQATLGTDTAANSMTRRAGVYEAWPRTLDGELQVERYAVNVDSREGQLAVIGNEDLATNFADTQAQIVQADDLVFGGESEDGLSWSRFLMAVLVGLLLLEQILGYATSYHPVRRIA